MSNLVNIESPNWRNNPDYQDAVVLNNFQEATILLDTLYKLGFCWESIVRDKKRRSGLLNVSDITLKKEFDKATSGSFESFSTKYKHERIVIFISKEVGGLEYGTEEMCLEMFNIPPTKFSEFNRRMNFRKYKERKPLPVV